MNRGELEFLRRQFPRGSRIRLTEMVDEQWPVEPGSFGTLESIDDVGTIHVRWDNGRGLGLVPGKDVFTILPPETRLLKLYMPVAGDLYKDGDETRKAEMDGKDLQKYEDAINGVIRKFRQPEESLRGLMYWYASPDAVERKVQRVEIVTEERDRQLWGVAECHITEQLTDEELETLKGYVRNQASEILGNLLEQCPVVVDEGVLYVRLWQWGTDTIQTEQERFGPKYADGLPELCFSVMPGTGELICLKRGEHGYYPSDWSTSDRAENRRLADEQNERLGVSAAQRMAMETGAMIGWNVPGADPAVWEKAQEEGVRLEQHF